MMKSVLKFGLTIAACSFLVSPREAAANTSDFPSWQACDDFMYGAHKECVKISHISTSGVTDAMCDASWDVTCAYCDNNYE